MYKKLEEIVEREVTRSNKVEQEYWGPMTIDFSDAYLNMVYSMLRSYFSKGEIKLLKAIFTTVTELVQNIAEYNEKNFENAQDPLFFSLILQKQHAQINCSNPILNKDVNPLRERFVQLDNLRQDNLEKEYKKALFKDESLGLLMIYKLLGVKVKWNIKKDKDHFSWLSINVKLNYASFRN